MSVSRLCGLLFALLAGVPALLAQDRTRIGLADFLEYEQVRDFFRGGGPQISPDGRQIVYTRWWVDKMNDRWKASLWLMNADGSRNRWLLDAVTARWSPDGSRIAWVASGEPSGAQIFVRYMDAEGAVTQVTRLDQGPGALAWSPDGRWIAFTMLVPEAGTLSAAVPGRPAGATWSPEPKIVERLDYRRDYSGYSDAGHGQIFVVPAGGGTPRQLTSGPWDHNAPAWTSDGKQLLFSSLRVQEAEYEWRESEIYAVDVASGDIRQLTHRKGPDAGPVASPDGKLVAYTGYDWTDDTYIASRLYLMNADGSNPRDISGGLDRSPENLLWAPDGGGVYFSAQSEGRSDFYFAPLTGKPRKLTSGADYLTVMSLSNTGLAAGTRTTATDPGNIVTLDLKNPVPQQVTDINGDLLAGKGLARTEEIWYTTADGFRIQGWIMRPPGFDPGRKYPLMLAIHGGPHGMYALATPYMWFEWQYYAAQGYVVLWTNPRGSSGYGSAFGNAIKNAYPGKDYDDLMAGVDTVLSRGYVDRDNMFVYGCSGGGVLTAWVVGHTDRFAAASSECPVINWLSFVGTTDGPGWYRNFAKLPWEDPSEHLRRSPLMYVGNVKTPTLLITGENDLRTPISQTEEYYEALKLLKVPTAMVRLQDQWHAYFYRPSNTMRTLAVRQQWFDRYRKQPPPVP
ncbi:MAG TPA: S9 family peptidase [Gemmatimonadales bacterium]